MSEQHYADPCVLRPAGHERATRQGSKSRHTQKKTALAVAAAATTTSPTISTGASRKLRPRRVAIRQ
jgi:hypothetical protein